MYSKWFGLQLKLEGKLGKFKEARVKAESGRTNVYILIMWSTQSILINFIDVVKSKQSSFGPPPSSHYVQPVTFIIKLLEYIEIN